MKISRLKSKLKLFYAHFIIPKKDWHRPKKSQVLIYDKSGADLILPYLTKYSYIIMPVRGESINLHCLLRAVFKLKFWQGKIINAHQEAFIETVSPKVIITFIDNNVAFYELSKRFPSIKTIFIQNGTRGVSGDVFDGLVNSNNYFVDFMLVHGLAIGRHYLKYVSGKFIPIGSLKNNTFNNFNSAIKNDILFISQWHSRPLLGDVFYIENDGTQINWDVFFEAEIKVLRFLDKWCLENNRRLKICGRGEEKHGPEKEFYSRHLNRCKWKYLPRIDSYSSYKLIDEAALIVFIDSTLGYESIARGKKAAVFSCRGLSIDSNAANFGWPENLPSNGPFWTNDQDETQFRRVMDYINTVSDENWKKNRERYAGKLMEFDPGNTRFVALLKQLLPRLENHNYVN